MGTVMMTSIDVKGLSGLHFLLLYSILMYITSCFFCIYNSLQHCENFLRNPSENRQSQQELQQQTDESRKGEWLKDIIQLSIRRLRQLTLLQFVDVLIDLRQLRPLSAL